MAPQRSWRKSRRRELVFGAIAAALVGVGAGAVAIRAQGLPPLTRASIAEELGTKLRPAPTLPAGETREQTKERLLQEGGGTVHDIRERTRGKPITLGGKTVVLPPDAYVDGIVTHSLCGGTQAECEVPFYNIRRGRSLINVVVRSGRILSEHPAPGEERAFDFLKEALR